jgi:hypothetical protein
MKKLVLFILLTCPFTALSNQQVGIFLGSPMSGIQYRVDDLRFSFGLDDIGLAFDKTFSVAELLGKPKLAPVYAFLGGQFVDHKNNKVAVRSGVGFLLPVEDFTFYGEVGPSLYVVEDVELKLEASLGVRISF